MEKFNKRIKNLRIEKGLTQSELAKQLNISQTCIAKWESGTRSPSIEYLILLAKYFGCSIDYLVGFAEY